MPLHLPFTIPILHYLTDMTLLGANPGGYYYYY